MKVGSMQSIGTMTVSRFVDITSWPRNNITSFVGGELSFLKLGSILVGFSGGVSNIS